MKPEYPSSEWIPQLKKLWHLGFGDSEDFIDLFFSTAFSPDRCRVILLEGQPVAAHYWLDVTCRNQKMAYLYAVVTHPDFRGQGLCRRLMEDTHVLFRAQGYCAELLVPGEPGLRRMYAKMGYQNCGGIQEFACTATQPPVPLRRISREEYTLLRRTYLPEGGVLQEQENLAYLETFSKFYAGEDFLLTALPEKDELFGVELLGRADAAPGILSALGYGRGRFRLPGDSPFAMYYPLTEDALPPAYFGLAFD